MSGWVEIERRVWFRTKWIRQYAVIEASGMLMISSSVCYDKNLYRVNGGHAILIDSAEDEEDAQILPSIQIKLDPSLQMEGGSSVTFRLTSTEDVSSWIHALSRCALSGPTRCNHDRMHALLLTRNGTAGSASCGGNVRPRGRLKISSRSATAQNRPPPPPTAQRRRVRCRGGRACPRRPSRRRRPVACRRRIKPAGGGGDSRRLRPVWGPQGA
jgi:hypothetical protein